MTDVARALRRRCLAAIIAGLAILPMPLAAPVAAGPLPIPGPTATAVAGTPPSPRPFRVELAGERDYVRQANFVQCVGASVQMMLNMTRPGTDRSRRTQHRLQVLARSQSGPRPDGRTRQGAGVFGWAAALNHEGAGPYAVVGARTLQGAMRIAARAIVEQGRPVGLLVWQGRHAWVMSGFQSTRDPRDGSFRVTRASILDPLHPHGSKVWGPSPTPGRPISVAAVGRQFVARRSHSEWNQLPGMAELAGKWVLVIPVDGPAPPNPVAAAGLVPRLSARPVATPRPAATTTPAPAPVRRPPTVRWMRGLISPC